MITRIDKLKTLTKHLSCKGKRKFDGPKYNSNQNCSQQLYLCECKNSLKHHVCEKDHVWNPSKCACENWKFLESIIGDSVATCDEIIEMTKSIPTKIVPIKAFHQKLFQQILIKIITCKIDHFCILLIFLLINRLLLIIVIIYCCLIKHQSKEKHLLPYPDTINKAKEIEINNIM